MKRYPDPSHPVHGSRCAARHRLAISGALFTTTVLILFTNALLAPPARAEPMRTAAVSAAERSTARTMRVAYRDLDLTQPQHVALLHDRLKTAARRLCRASKQMIANGESFAPNCFVAAMADGKRQIDDAVIVAFGEHRKDAMTRDGFARLP